MCMRALSRPCGNGIPASGQEGGRETEHRSTVPCSYSRTGCARCARSTRSRSAARNPRVCDETVDASRSINADVSPEMGNTDLAEETRGRVATTRAPEDGIRWVSDETSYARSQTQRG